MRVATIRSSGLSPAITSSGVKAPDRLFGDFGSNNAPASGNDVLYGEAGDDLLLAIKGTTRCLDSLESINSSAAMAVIAFLAATTTIN